MTKIRTRFAPSPTGRMHVGNLRSALYEFLIAKHDGGDFMLRIEDRVQSISFMIRLQRRDSAMMKVRTRMEAMALMYRVSV